MNTRIAALSLIVEDRLAAEPLNQILHEYASYILGRMGIPYREKNLNIICLIVDAPQDVINALTGKLGRLPGVNAKAVYAPGETAEKKEK